ncbi:hypothetical protein [Yersinia hibernica]|uniref:Uncharacterized protein n=1 Tax=Yersinia enterocolitica LC20 TaxID=1443113 RepID=A0A7U4K0T5_YEREN|nr:hypothetical protein [Yersinia hibernica]AHM72982.1 hypothetical protein LC20_01729 [Yersinia hibernica]
MSQLLNLLDRPIAYQRSFVRLGVGITGAVLLSQMVYWHNRITIGQWFYKTQSQLEEETGLTRYEQEGARRKLRDIGVLEESKQGIPAKLFFRLNHELLQRLLLETDTQPSVMDSHIQGCGNSTYSDGENQQAGMGQTSVPASGNPASIHTVDYTETTTETTNTLAPSGDDAPAKRIKNDYSAEFETAWANYPKREGSNSKPAAFKCWNARRKAGVTSEVLLAGVERYAKFCQAKGQTNTAYVMQATRFFGPGCEYENLWSAMSPQAASNQKPSTHTGFANRNYGTTTAPFMERFNK